MSSKVRENCLYALIPTVDVGSHEGKRKAHQYGWGGYASTDFRVIPGEKLFQILVRQQVPVSQDVGNAHFPIGYQGVK